MIDFVAIVWVVNHTLELGTIISFEDYSTYAKTHGGDLSTLFVFHGYSNKYSFEELCGMLGNKKKIEIEEARGGPLSPGSLSRRQEQAQNAANLVLQTTLIGVPVLSTVQLSEHPEWDKLVLIDPLLSDTDPKQWALEATHIPEIEP